VTKKWGGKRAKLFFQKHKSSASKNFGKKNVEKNALIVYKYSHEYRDQKIGGNKHAKQFLQEHTNSASKKVGKKIVGKSAKNVFLYSHE